MAEQGKIVFVVGAGASAPYGFPVGRKLVESICERYTKTAERFRTVEEGRSSSSYDGAAGFCNALRSSGRDSIDLFLSHNPGFDEHGKTAIAAELLAYENSIPYYNVPADEDWIRWLVNQVTSGSSNSWLQLLAFVTFNYDRVLEYMLHLRLLNSFGELNSETAAAIVNEADIIHLHGYVCPLPWQTGIAHTDVSAEYRAYEQGTTGVEIDKIRWTMVKAAREGIRIIHEARDDSEPFTAAHTLIASARLIVFLGFGYDGVNVGRLKPWTSEHLAAVFGTAYGMSPAQQGLAAERVANLWAIKSGTANVHIDNCSDRSCLDFMLNCSHLLRELERMRG